MTPAFPPVSRVAGIAAPLLLDNIDTDAIIPSREIKSVGRAGLAEGLFAGWRYTEGRTPNPDFVLNRPAYAHAPILLTGDNVGCGSSREHAVWALHEFGIRAVIAPSFAPIFRGNCIVNGIIPAALDRATLERIAGEGGQVVIDLADLSITAGDMRASFALDDEERAMLAEGLDAIDLTLRRRDAIAAFHAADRQARPWIYLAPTA